jgi:hypothetical protein
MKLPQSIAVRAGFGALLLLSVFAWAPATYPGYWQALEGFTPVFNVTRTSALANVAVTPDLWRGVGSATFLLSRPFLLLTGNPTLAVRIGFILCFLLGSLGCYSWLQQRLGDRAAGLAGVIFLFAPPLLATVYIRGSLSDATIAALLPLALAGLASYSQTRTLSAAGIAVIATLWMWQTQAGLALFATVLLLAYALLVEQSWLAGLIVLVSGAAGGTSLASVWTTSGPAPVVFSDHFVYLYQLFRQQWLQAPSTVGWQDSFPLQLSVVALLYLVWSGLLLLRRQQTGPGHEPMLRRLWLFSTVVALLLTLATLQISAPLWQWSHAERLLTYPWQLALLALPLWAAAAGLLPTRQPVLRQTPTWVALLFVVLLGSYPYLTADFTEVTIPNTPVAIFGGQNDIVILDAALTENRQPRTTELDLTWQVLRPLPFDYNIFFQALRIEQSGQTESGATTNDAAPPTETTLSVVGQLDRQPLTADAPPMSWQPGEIFTATYQLDLTTVADDVPLVYYFGYYDWRDGVRLPVNLGIDDKLIIYGK